MPKAEHYLDLESTNDAVIYPKGNRPALEVRRSFSFVLNVGKLVDPPNGKVFSVAPGNELRRANRAEIAAIKDVLPDFAAQTTWGAWQNGAPIPMKDGGTTYAHIPEGQWRYFVISFDGSNSTSTQIERAFSIAPFELKIGFTLLREAFRGSGAPTLIYHPARLFSQVKRLSDGELPFIDVTQADVESIRLLADQVRTFSHPPLNLKQFLEQVLDLDTLPHRSRLLFLGYFAVLESLVTHQPKKTDTIDSITRQVKQKVALLDNRWQPRIDYSAFGTSKPDTIWSTMYAYRSCLAHGGEPDFKDDLQLLHDHGQALGLLRQTVKSILRQALSEPQLVLDLRDC
jgi:hypothetical protein